MAHGHYVPAEEARWHAHRAWRIADEALRAARDQAERAARIVRAKRQEGASDLLEWLDAERTFAETEAVLAAQDGQISRKQIALFRALAGGWST